MTVNEPSACSIREVALEQADADATRAANAQAKIAVRAIVTVL